MDLPAKPTKQKKKSSHWTFREVATPRSSGRDRGNGVIIILLKLFFFQIPDLVHTAPSHPTSPTLAGSI